MKIGLLGCGVVGSGVYEIIENQLSPMVSDIEIVKILVRNHLSKNDQRRKRSAGKRGN